MISPHFFGDNENIFNFLIRQSLEDKDIMYYLV